ncbi:MAG: hypothetical protein Q7V57_02565 [Actinomycetota bacterium]|nr:hypothetical protein [Actinomycetota bacterium]
MRSQGSGRVRGVLCAVVLAGLVACTDAGSQASTTTATAPASDPPSSTAPASTTSGASTGGDSSPSSTTGGGVPGLDDPDAYCAAWAAYSGTLQAIGVAQAFGGLSSSEVARLEVVAAASLVAAVGEIGANWPSQLLIERSEVLSNLVGPFGRRAQRALTMLLDAGATDSELQQFAQLWDEALHSRLPDEPVIALPPLSSELEDLVRTVAQQFDAAVTPFADDPSLNVSAVAAPLTDAYLADQCPDLASSGVGDAV